MKILRTSHNSLPYRFEFFQRTGVVEVLKSEVHTYTMQLRPNGAVACDCPGAVYHGNCWHRNDIWPILLKAPVCKETWCDWAEEAKELQYANQE